MSITLKPEKCPLDGFKVKNGICTKCRAQFNVDRRRAENPKLKRFNRDIDGIYKWANARGWEGK